MDSAPMLLCLLRQYIQIEKKIIISCGRNRLSDYFLSGSNGVTLLATKYAFDVA